MITYFMRVPDLEPQTLIQYNEIFKEILRDVYGIVPRKNWIDANKISPDVLKRYLPSSCDRGCTINYSRTGAICYGYDYDLLARQYDTLIEVNAGLEKCEFIGAI